MNVLIVVYGRENEIENAQSIKKSLENEHNVLLATVIKHKHISSESLLEFHDYEEKPEYSKFFYYFFQDRFINDMSELDAYVAIGTNIEEIWDAFYRMVGFALKVLNKFKPDIIYCGAPDNYFSNLFISFAEERGIKYFWLEKSYHVSGYTFFSKREYSNDIFRKGTICKPNGSKNLENLFVSDVYNNSNISFKEKDIVKKIIENLEYIMKNYIFSSMNKKDRLLIPYYSEYHLNFMNKIKRIFNRISYKVFIEHREMTIDGLKRRSAKYKFVLFALHYQPEAATLSLQPLYNDQYYLLKLIADLLPPKYILLVKEHPLQDIGLRKRNFYKSIVNKRNIFIVNKYVQTSKLIEKLNIKKVITIGGTVGFEQILRRNPPFIFSDIYYSNFKYCFYGDFKSSKELLSKLLEYLDFSYKDVEEEYEKSLKEFLCKYEKSLVKIEDIDKAIKFVIDNLKNYWI
jgi:hypothetical protein